MLLLRCRQCRNFFSPSNGQCPKCHSPWDVKGARKSFYHDFAFRGRRVRVKCKAISLHWAKVEHDRFNPEEWWKSRKEQKRVSQLPTFSSAIPLYLQWCEFQGCGARGPNRKSTLASKQNSFNNHLCPYLGGKRVDEISDQHIFEFIVQEKDRRQPESVNLDLKYLRTFFSWCIDRGYRIDNPMRKIKLLEEKGPRIDLRFKDWEMALLAKGLEDTRIPSHKRNIVKALLLTGLRGYSEVARAEWNWYDPESETLTVPPGATKGKKAIRKVLSARMAKLLNDMLLTNTPGCPYIFPNPETQKPFQDLRTIVQGVCRDSGIDRWDRVSVKWFRHNYLSWGGAIGLPAERLQETVGHANARTTLGYTHLYDREKREVEDQICETFFECAQNRAPDQKTKGSQEIPTA